MAFDKARFHILTGDNRGNIEVWKYVDDETLIKNQDNEKDSVGIEEAEDQADREVSAITRESPINETNDERNDSETPTQSAKVGSKPRVIKLRRGFQHLSGMHKVSSRAHFKEVFFIFN